MADCYSHSRRRVLENAVIVTVVTVVMFSIMNLPAIFPEHFDSVKVPDKTNVLPYNYAVASSDDYATNFGYDILMKGGNVFDAIVGMQAMLALTEPMSNGWGGGSHILVRMADGRVIVIDGGSEAPADAKSASQGSSLGGASVAVPGTMYAMMSGLEKYGKFSAKTLFEPVIDRARNTDEWSAQQLVKNQKKLAMFPDAAAIYLRDGESPIAQSDTIFNPDYARFLETILDKGWRTFYNGTIADAIVEAVRNDEFRPGRMTKEDLANYKAVERAPLNTTWNGRTLYGAQTGGSVTLFLALHIIEDIVNELSRSEPHTQPTEEDTWAGHTQPENEHTKQPQPQQETVEQQPQPAPVAQPPPVTQPEPAPVEPQPAPESAHVVQPEPAPVEPQPESASAAQPSAQPQPEGKTNQGHATGQGMGGEIGQGHTNKRYGGGSGFAPKHQKRSESKKRYNPFEQGLTVESITYLLNTLSLAFADKQEWVADPDWTDVPFAGLLNLTYAKKRARLIKPFEVLDPAPAGTPPGSGIFTGHIERRENTHSGTHFSVADGYGNVAVVTSTLEQAFGSCVVVPGFGFMLNSQLVDFSASGRNELEGGKKVRRNALPPDNTSLGGKRPRAHASPVILVKDGKPELILGSPGGTSTPGVLFNTLVNIYYRNMMVAEGIYVPRVVSQNNGTWLLESAFFSESHMTAIVDELARMGADPNVFLGDQTGAVAAIKFLDDGTLEAVADKRYGYATAKVSEGYAFPEASWIVKYKKRGAEADILS